MAKQVKHLVPVQSTPATRVVHYVDVAHRPDAELAAWSVAELAAQRARQRAEQRELYARWVVRQARIAERDRKIRRFWIGFGAVIAAAVLAGVAGLVWLALHAATVTGLGLLAIPLVLLLLGGLAAGGHRCITVIQHWH